MALYNYITPKRSESGYRKGNIVDLLNRAKVEQRKEKINTIIYAVAAISVLAISGLIISL